jgi:hypothetical protein
VPFESVHPSTRAKAKKPPPVGDHDSVGMVAIRSATSSRRRTNSR